MEKPAPKMKHSTPSTMKFLKLKRRLRLPHWQTVGLLESLWLFTQVNTPHGDIGRHSNEDIAAAIEWDGDADELVAHLVECRWLDASAEHRLVVHDWHQHAPNYLKGAVASTGKKFVSDEKTAPRLSPPAKPPGLAPPLSPPAVGAGLAPPQPNLTKPNLTKPNGKTAAEAADVSPHKLAIAGFTERWAAKYGGAKYPFDRSRDPAAMKEILGFVESDLAKLWPIMDRYFADDDPYYAAGDRHKLAKMKTHFARWLVQGKDDGSANRNGTTQRGGPDSGGFSADVIKNYRRPADVPDRTAGPQAKPNGHAPAVGPPDGPGAAESSEGESGRSDSDISF